MTKTQRRRKQRKDYHWRTRTIEGIMLSMALSLKRQQEALMMRMSGITPLMRGTRPRGGSGE